MTYKHGKTKSKVYRAWQHSKERCYNKSCKKYPRYGGRGIKVCDRWKDSFENFYIDMGDPPTEKHTLGRIDNDGDYCPENCRWETYQDQMNNTSRTVLLTFDGKTQSVTQWNDDLGFKRGTLRRRIVDFGYSVDMALNTEVASPKQTEKRMLTAFGETLTLSEWSRRTGIPYGTISSRIYESGWSIEDALTKKENPTHRFIILDDERLTLSQWSRRTGIPYGCLKRRFQRGWDAQKALTTPLT